ncbi:MULTISPECIES: hypothetical protein [unclassified Leptotrichia]|uniref:hypothetical protein n=1 Tax=unclassified Leptotrichia TaxID=2633022 RepID=UPI0003AE7E72|nr:MULTISPECIES: hypothetical protein [unclassified Leptotrichia]ERL25475.1 hypothetical protein HMPREF9108_01882 [Leptotrichia sp. oral taxon 225 str. F0581]WLD74578.1 hypothetical protein QU666_01575 [Leptotrichia sp. HMT-225]
MLAKLSEHSEFFVSAEKCRRLAIGTGFAAMSNPVKIKKKKHSNIIKYLLIKISKKQ